LAQSYQRNKRECEGNEVQDVLESYVREGARRMLVAVLEEEVNAFLGRHRYERGKAFRGYRNGYHPAREVTVGLGPVEVRVPRAAQVPADVGPQGFQSQIVRRYQRASQTTQRLFARLYPSAGSGHRLEGLATGDFEPVFRELVGETTALSANAVVRLKECWRSTRRGAGGPCGGISMPTSGPTASAWERVWRKRRRRSCVCWVPGRMERRNR
jgi:hypothetical protein